MSNWAVTVVDSDGTFSRDLLVYASSEADAIARATERLRDDEHVSAAVRVS